MILGMASRRSSPVDPLSERSRNLTAEIAALEAQIRDLGAQIETARSPSEPRDSNENAAAESDANPSVFTSTSRPAMPTQGLFLGGRAQPDPGEKTTLSRGRAGRGRRKRPRSTPTADPRLISYLAAGSIQGLRPLRYEKRVARNRVFALTLVFLFVVWGLIALLRH